MDGTEEEGSKGGGRLSKGRIRDICPFWSGAKLKPAGHLPTTRPSILPPVILPSCPLSSVINEGSSFSRLASMALKPPDNKERRCTTFSLRSINRSNIGIEASTFCFYRYAGISIGFSFYFDLE